jgi:protease I
MPESTSGPLNGRTVAFLTSQKGIEEVELVKPWQAVADAGGRPLLFAPESGTVQAVEHDDAPAGTYPVDRTFVDTTLDGVDAIVIPGGTINADKLRLVPEAVALVQDAVERRIVVAAICHGPWALVEAGVVRGRRVTSYPSVRTDVINAGGEWIDQPVVVDDSGGYRLITSRRPRDLEPFSAAIIDALS